MDKSEQASSFKLAEARKKGEVAKSQEFLSACALVILVSLFAGFLAGIALAFFRLTKTWLSNLHLAVGRAGQAELVYLAEKLTTDILSHLLLALGLGALLTICVAFVHVGPVFAPKILAPNLSRLSPVAGLKKIFTRRALIEVVKMILKLAVFTVVGYYVLIPVVNGAGQFVADNMHMVLVYWRQSLGKVLISFCMVVVLFGLIDLFLSRREFAKKMRMSKRDVKDEYKRQEGSPEIKQRRKKNQNELIKKFAAMTNIKNADAIVVNPTHYAVALQYRPKTMALPIVSVKGRGSMAWLIRKRAARYGVPIKSLPALARQLYADVEIGAPISTEVYNEVAVLYKELIADSRNRVFS